MLDVEVMRVGKVVFGRVLEQSQDTPLPRIESNLVIKDLQSWIYPELYDNTLCIRGSDHRRDNDLFYFEFSSKHQARVAVKDIKRLVNLSNKQAREREGEYVDKNNPYVYIYYRV